MAHALEIEIGRRFRLEHQTGTAKIRSDRSMKMFDVDLTGLPVDRDILIERLSSFDLVEGVPEGIKLDNATFSFVSSKDPLVAFYAIDLEPSARVTGEKMREGKATGEKWHCAVNVRCTRCPRYCLSEPCPFKNTVGR